MTETRRLGGKKMATLSGSSGFAVAISTTKAGDAGSETPTGDIIYLWCEKISINDKSEDRVRVLSNYTSLKIPTGKMSLGVTLGNVIIGKFVSGTATEELDVVRNFIREHSVKIGGTKVYIFVKNIADDKYVKLGWNTSHTQIRYYYGYPEPTTWEMDKGKMYKAMSLKFQDVTM